MKTYLVTGAAGFIGARFVESCNQRGISVISVDEKGLFSARPEHRGIDFGQVVDRDELFTWLSSQRDPRISAVIHMGACANTMETDVAYLQRVNVEYSQSLWAYCTANRIPLTYASSAATYGDGAMGYDDDESSIPRLQPLNEYGRSKQLFDLWVLEQERAGNMPPAWSGFKFFNVYGYGERHKGRMASVILHAYEQIRTSGEVKLFQSHRPGIADGEQKRDFVAVEDVLDVLHFAIDQPIPRGIFNLGTGRAQTFLDLARAVFEALRRPAKIEFVPTPVEIRDKYQYFTEAKMGKLRAAGYSRAFMDLRQGVQRYITRIGASS